MSAAESNIESLEGLAGFLKRETVGPDTTVWLEAVEWAIDKLKQVLSIG